jgi:hypothetical protein
MSAKMDNPAVSAPGTDSRPDVASSTPVLIAVQEVVFKTAAAMPVRQTTLRRWAGAPSVVLTALRRMLLPSSPDVRTPRGYFPRRYSYLEQAELSREMDRL